jgi:O-antigen/teichoic acid export membrane protein
VIITTYILSVLHIGSTDLQEHHPLVLISFAIPLIAFGALLSRILQSAKHLALANLPWRIMLPVLKISLIILFIFLLNTIALWQVILTGVLSVIIVISFQWYKIRQLNLIELKRSPHFINSAQTLQLSIPMMLAMLVTMAVNQIDLFMLELFAKEHEVGHFAAATTTAHIIPIAQVTIVGLFLPLISPAIKQGYQSAKSLFWQGQKVIMISTSLIAITLLVAGEKLLSLFGPDYSQAIQTLWLLICGYLIWSFAAFSSTWLQYDDKGFWVVIVGIVTLILDGSLNFALIPLYGIKGAAMATTISLSLAALCICLFRYKHSKEN